MQELLPPTLEDAIAELERESRMRGSVYPRLISVGRMTEARAERQQGRLTLAIKLLKETLPPPTDDTEG